MWEETQIARCDPGHRNPLVHAFRLGNIQRRLVEIGAQSKEMKGPAMASDIDKAIQENMKFTLDLADKILLSAGKDSNGAFIKAIGTLAQVKHSPACGNCGGS
jgi:hypothetical protein